MSRMRVSGTTRPLRSEIALLVLAALALAVQVSGLALIRPADPARAIAPIVVGPPEPGQPEAKVGLLWRDFRPGQHLVETRSGLICGAALQRGTGSGTLVVRFCTDVPTTPVRRFGLGYDSLVIEATLPGGGRLSYSLLDFAPEGTDRGRSFTQGPTRDNTVPVRNVFVRDATDVIVVLDADVPAGLPSVGVRGSLGGVSFSEIDPFEPLGAGADQARLEIEHALTAPSWAKETP